MKGKALFARVVVTSCWQNASSAMSPVQEQDIIALRRKFAGCGEADLASPEKATDAMLAGASYHQGGGIGKVGSILLRVAASRSIDMVSKTIQDGVSDGRTRGAGVPLGSEPLQRCEQVRRL
jgi:hypothetical protein